MDRGRDGGRRGGRSRVRGGDAQRGRGGGASRGPRGPRGPRDGRGPRGDGVSRGGFRSRDGRPTGRDAPRRTLPPPNFDDRTLGLLRQLQDRIRQLERQQPRVNTRNQAANPVRRLGNRIDRNLGERPPRRGEGRAPRRGFGRRRRSVDERDDRVDGRPRFIRRDEGAVRDGGRRSEAGWRDGASESFNKRRRREGPQDRNRDYPRIQVTARRN